MASRPFSPLPRVGPGLLVLIVALAAVACPALAAGGGTKGKASSAESSNSPYFVMEPMPVSIIKESAGMGLLVVEIGLDAKTLEDRQNIERLTPRLRDIYLQVLGLYASRDLKTSRPPNVEVIKQRLQAATDDVLGPDHATVLLRQVLVRRSL